MSIEVKKIVKEYTDKLYKDDAVALSADAYEQALLGLAARGVVEPDDVYVSPEGPVYFFLWKEKVDDIVGMVFDGDQIVFGRGKLTFGPDRIIY